MLVSYTNKNSNLKSFFEECRLDTVFRQVPHRISDPENKERADAIEVLIGELHEITRLRISPKVLNYVKSTMRAVIDYVILIGVKDYMFWEPLEEPPRSTIDVPIPPKRPQRYEKPFFQQRQYPQTAHPQRYVHSGAPMGRPEYGNVSTNVKVDNYKEEEIKREFVTEHIKEPVMMVEEERKLRRIKGKKDEHMKEESIKEPIFMMEKEEEEEKVVLEKMNDEQKILSEEKKKGKQKGKKEEYVKEPIMMMEKVEEEEKVVLEDMKDEPMMVLEEKKKVGPKGKKEEEPMKKCPKETPLEKVEEPVIITAEEEKKVVPKEGTAVTDEEPILSATYFSNLIIEIQKEKNAQNKDKGKTSEIPLVKNMKLSENVPKSLIDQMRPTPKLKGKAGKVLKGVHDPILSATYFNNLLNNIPAKVQVQKKRQNQCSKAKFKAERAKVGASKEELIDSSGGDKCCEVIPVPEAVSVTPPVICGEPILNATDFEKLLFSNEVKCKDSEPILNATDFEKLLFNNEVKCKNGEPILNPTDFERLLYSNEVKCKDSEPILNATDFERLLFDNEVKPNNNEQLPVLERSGNNEDNKPDIWLLAPDSPLLENSEVRCKEIDNNGNNNSLDIIEEKGMRMVDNDEIKDITYFEELLK